MDVRWLFLPPPGVKASEHDRTDKNLHVKVLLGFRVLLLHQYEVDF